VLPTRPTETPRGDGVANTEDTQLVADFVRRLRRVALHPLALDEQGDDDQLPPLPGDLLRRLMHVPTSVADHGDGTVTVRSPLPDEVQFESLATRLRPFTLASDRLHWPKALGALDRLTGLEDPALRSSSSDLGEEWRQATDRTSRARAFYTGYQLADNGGPTQHLTDIDLAYAWLYQDVPTATRNLRVTSASKSDIGQPSACSLTWRSWPSKPSLHQLARRARRDQTACRHLE